MRSPSAACGQPTGGLQAFADGLFTRRGVHLKVWRVLATLSKSLELLCQYKYTLCAPLNSLLGVAFVLFIELFILIKIIKKKCCLPLFVRVCFES